MSFILNPGIQLGTNRTGYILSVKGKDKNEDN